jgi:hypothetical protein
MKESIDNTELLISIRDNILDVAEQLKNIRKDLHEKLIQAGEDLESIFHDDSDEVVWPATVKEIVDCFGINTNTFNSHRRRLREKGELKEGIDYFRASYGQEHLFTKGGAIKILRKTSPPKIAKYLMRHGIQISPKDQHQYIDIIRFAVERFDKPESQFKVVINNEKYYIIDLYLPNYKLAIECDEFGHDYSSPPEESRREEEIINELNCNFLRFNPHDQDFNIGEVINIIFSYILNKKIDGEDPIDYFNSKKKRKKKKKRVGVTDVYITDEELDLLLNDL